MHPFPYRHRRMSSKASTTTTKNSLAAICFVLQVIWAAINNLILLWLWTNCQLVDSLLISVKSPYALCSGVSRHFYSYQPFYSEAWSFHLYPCCPHWCMWTTVQIDVLCISILFSSVGSEPWGRAMRAGLKSAGSGTETYGMWKTWSFRKRYCPAQF